MVEGVHAKNQAKHDRLVQRDEMARLQNEQKTMEAKARAEADAKLADKRQRSGRAASIATSPLGLTDAAPISKASLAGRSLLG